MTENLKCIIIDDSRKDRENIRMLLESYCPNTQIIGEANDRESILELLTTTNPDLVFIDIHIGPHNVFDIINDLEDISFKIVFVSAFDKYAIKGYQYDAIDYLLKPVDSKQLIKVVDKVKKLKKEYFLKQNLIDDIRDIYSKITEDPKISITDTKGVHILKANNILYCMGGGNYSTITLMNDDEIIISKNLKQFEDKLAPFNFLRIHKSYLINLNHIDFLVKEQGGTVIMKNGKTIPISRNAKKELMRRMNIL